MTLQATGSKTQAPVRITNPPVTCRSSSSLRRRAPTRLSTRFVSCKFDMKHSFSDLLGGHYKPGEEADRQKTERTNFVMNPVVSARPRVGEDFQTKKPDQRAPLGPA